MESAQFPLLECETRELASEGDVFKKHARKGVPAFRKPINPDIFPDSLCNLIGKDHVAYRLIEALQQADLSAVMSSYGHLGGSPYHPINLIAVRIFGIMDGVTSERQLEEHCKYDVRYMFLMGGHKPDDRCFGRILARIDSHIDSIFREIMLVLRKGPSAKRSGLEAIIDGSKVACDASWWKYCKQSDEPPSDPEARLQNSHGRKMVGYNVQVVTDAQDGTILAAEVVSNQDDSHVASQVMDTMKRQHGSHPTMLIGDTGYETSETIEVLENQGIDSVICPDSKLTECLREDAEGMLRCPAGKAMIKRSEAANGSGTLYDLYKPEGGCRGCPLAQTCAFKGKTLHVIHNGDPGARFRNRDRVRSAAYSDAMRKRRRVERVFARMGQDGLDRFRRRGCKKVRTIFILWAISYNLRTLEALILAFIEQFLGRFDTSGGKLSTTGWGPLSFSA
jgi:hypothetical protein